ncbi:MAG: type I-B CRISPR-associated protein Cas8b1/Cst1 [Candidatus Heimdallarchaeota archaeon]
MSKTQQLYDLTGNAFVDSGIATICSITKKHYSELNKEDLLYSLNYAHDIYSVKEWRGNIMGILFPNSEICNPSTVKKEPNKFKKVLTEYIDLIEPISNSGSCVICGSRNGKPELRMRIPMLGSGKSINFFPMGQSGENICAGCSFAVQFLPLYITKVGNKVIVLQSTDSSIVNLYSKTQIEKINKKISAKQLKEGFLKNEKKGINSIFDIIEDIAITYDLNKMSKNPNITFYYFTNYGQTNPFDALHIYKFPNEVFYFIRTIIYSHLEKDWKKILIQGFPKKKRNDPEKAYKSYKNKVYFRLLEGRSITFYFLDRVNKTHIGSWSLLEIYLSLVMQMNDEIIEKIKILGDKIVEVIEKTQEIKRIKAIDWAKNYRAFRVALLRLAKDWASLNQDEPMIAVDDYLKMLFQDGKNSWSEIRDLLVFRFLEKSSKNILEKFAGIKDEENEN